MEKKMGIGEFAEEIRKIISGILCGGVKVECQEVVKQNDCICHGIVFMEDGGIQAPMYNMEPLYNAYLEGCGVGKLAMTLLGEYTKSGQSEMALDWFKDFPKVRGKLAYRLVDRGRNRAYLEDKPYKSVFDLAKVYYVSVPDMEGAMVTVTNTHMDYWGISLDEVDSAATRNTEKLYPAWVLPMSEVLSDLGADMPGFMGGGMGMYVASNNWRLFGAAVVLYGGLLGGFAGMVGNDVYILPSSVHEAILIPDNGGISAGGLKQMLMEINRTCLAAEEVLSDSVYYYSRAKGGDYACSVMAGRWACPWLFPYMTGGDAIMAVRLIKKAGKNGALGHVVTK